MILPGIYASQISGHLTPPYSVPTNYYSIQTATVDSGGASSVTFSSIPSTYTHLQLRITGMYSATNNMYLQYNGDTAANYSWHQLYGDGSSANSNGGSNQVLNYIGYSELGTTYPSVNVVDILDYTNTNKYKTIRSLFGFDRNGGGVAGFLSGSWRNTNAITSITITPNGGNIGQYTSFALYGVK